jgi:hypothetical protein
MKNNDLIFMVAIAMALISMRICVDGQSFNVATYGAVGDAIQFNVNCTSNSTTLTTSNAVLTSAAIGDAIEVFKAGQQTTGTGNAGLQETNNLDLIAKIINVVGGTNITISMVASNTLTNAFATYGFNNDGSFQSAITATSGTGNSTIIIPPGNYLFLQTNGFCLYIPQGGLTFSGSGTNSTRLIGQSAWQLISGSVMRGSLFEVIGSTNINQPLIFQNLTMDGGLQKALSFATNGQAAPANIVDALGWDETHNAFVVNAAGNGPQDIINTVFTNVLFDHWAGEVTKELDNATNNNFLFTGFAFGDCNADCINTVGSTSASNGVFNGCFQPIEYQMGRMTNSGYFANCIITNCLRAFSFTSSQLNPPWYIVSGNIIAVSNLNAGALVMAVNQNLAFSNNWVLDKGYDNFLQFQNYSSFANQGPNAGVQSSNIYILNNTINSFANDIVFLGGSSITSTDSVFNVTFGGNTLSSTHTNYNQNVIADYGWHTNIFINQNVNTSPVNLNAANFPYLVTFAPGSLSAAFLSGFWFPGPVITAGNMTANSMATH